MHPVVCLDVGSTFTKGAAVDVTTGDLLATAAHATTIETDVLAGIDAVRADLAAQLPGADLSEVLACSSAGGGLRLAVVGYERAVTAEAGHRVGLSAGAKIVHVSSGLLTGEGLAALRADRPDVVLLVGGTDGGNTEVLVANARALAASPAAATGTVPVVVAGNIEGRAEVVGVLTAAGWPAIAAANVLPRIGVLDPLPARAAIREVFIAHVIGGKHLSASPAFAEMVRAATPDAVLAGVELLADGAAGTAGAGDVVVVDVGGATTDVYSVVTPDPEEAALHREVVEVMWRGRTVEGDLGVRWSAPGVVSAAVAERLLPEAEAVRLVLAAEQRAADPALLPSDAEGRAVDARLAELALTVALRRHARPQESGEVRNPGKDLRGVRLVVGSGGVLRHAGPRALQRILAPAVGDHAGGWKVPDRAALAVDSRYVLAAAGLLAASYPDAAARLLSRTLQALPRTAAAP
ncbi:MAG TPA: glutamate mutase L [Actinomycetes bacterium]